MQRLLKPADACLLYAVIMLRVLLLRCLQSDRCPASRLSCIWHLCRPTLNAGMAPTSVIVTCVSCTCAAAMHDQDPVFKQWSRSKRMTEVLKQLGMSQPVPVQSMYIFKASPWVLPGSCSIFCC